ncbi:MAG: DUF456 domain-containing protein [Armatimonadetes bacterium]|jgi:uncharacterized protein YqgC (DUF456 family)|nr:DUF456 domain-containing protein [Armatimonadota bacterium]NLN90166.1 DUF456 domain-containing protein [candidate division WS1 bacterium]
MQILWVVLFCLGLLCALLATAFGLPGTFLVLITVLIVSIASGFSIGPVWFLIVLALIATLTEVGDAVLSAWAVRKYEGTGRGQMGAVLLGLAGALIGGALTSILAAFGIAVSPLFALLLFIVGPVVGGCLGGFAGAVLGEMSHGRDRDDAIRAGWGAFIGRALGTVGKVIVCTIMAGVSAWMVIPGLLGGAGTAGS